MTATFIDEIAQYLQVNGIGTLGTNLFEGFLPDGVDQAVCIYESIGLKSEIDIPLNRPGFQVVIRDTELDLGETKADSIRTLLDRKYNIQFITNGTYVYSCNLTAQGGHIGQDPRGRDMFSLNFQCYVR